MNINNYTINEDLSVDVNESVDLYKKSLKYLPIQFGVVKGNFDISENELTSLLGSPHIIEGEFYCNENNLKSLEYGPKIVQGCYCCQNNHLTMLKGIPSIINGDLTVWQNNINTTKYFPKEIKGILDISNNKINSLKGLKIKVLESFYCHDIPLNEISYLEIQDLEVNDYIYLPRSFKKNFESFITVSNTPSLLRIPFNELKEYTKTLFEKEQFEKNILNNNVKLTRKTKV